MRYLFYIALLVFISFDVGTAMAAMVEIGPNALAPVYKGPARTAALSQEKLFSGNELTFAQTIWVDKFEKYQPRQKVSITAYDYGTLLLRLAKQAYSSGLTDKNIHGNPKLLRLFVRQYINGCLIMNLHPDIDNKRIITRLLNNLKKQISPGEILQANEKSLAQDRDLNKNIKAFNGALERSRQRFLGSPYESLYTALDVLYGALNNGKTLKSPRSRWAFFLPILREELSYLTTAGLAENSDMKRYVYYVTKLIHQIASGTHNKASRRTVVSTDNPHHRQLLGSLIDSGAAAYNMRMKYLYEFEARQEDKINNSFSDILRNHLKEFFPAQQSSQLFNHRLKAYIIFALGAYETYTNSLREHYIQYKVDKYTFINKQISEAIKTLIILAESRDHPSGSAAGYDAPEIIWEGFDIPILSKSITPALLGEIQKTLNPQLIETVDNRYVQPILVEEKEEKEEEEEAEHQSPRLRLSVAPDVSRQQKQQRVQSGPTFGGASSTTIPVAPPPPPPISMFPVPLPPPVSDRPVPPSSPLPRGIASPPSVARPAVKPSFLDDLTKTALGQVRLKKTAPPTMPQDKTTVSAPTGLMGTLVARLADRRLAMTQKDEGKKDSDEEEEEWDGEN